MTEVLAPESEVDRLLALSVQADDAGEYDQAVRLMQQACEISKLSPSLAAPTVTRALLTSKTGE